MTAPIGLILGVVVLLVLLPVVAAVVYRLVYVRRHSTSVLARRGEDWWSYGAIRYTDTEIAYYRLMSLRFRPDVRLSRRTLVLGKRRQPTGPELDIVEDGEIIVPFYGVDRNDETVSGELCVGPAELTGLMAWVEACSTEQVRPRRRRR